MYHTYKDTKIYYETIGDGKIPIVFLHGWGGNTKSFNFICKYLTFNYRALFIDFPPFGNSSEPCITFDMQDYYNLTKEILQKEQFYNPIVVGHSFGGRVAIMLGNSAKFTVLVAAAGLKPKRGLKYYYKTTKHKLLKRLGIKNIKGGSDDYKKLSNNMKKTFVNIVNTDLSFYAKQICVPTILFWGKKDNQTPFYMAKRLNKLIKTSKIISFKDAGHFCYIDKLPIFVAMINKIGYDIENA